MNKSFPLAQYRSKAAQALHTAFLEYIKTASEGSEQELKT